MPRRRFGLTARLALLGIASALVPFAVGGLVLLVVPSEVGGRQAEADLDSTLSLASARVQERRADLAFALARIDDATLTRLVGAGDVRGIERRIRSERLAAGDERAARLQVRVERTRQRQVARDGDLAAAVGVVRDGRPVQVVLVDPDGARRALQRIAREADTRVALVGPAVEAASLGDAADDEPWRVRLDDAGDVSFVAGAEPGRWRSLLVDEASGLHLVAGLDGGPVQLLLRGRGGDIQVALVLLLGAGILCAVSMALIMNRMLGRVADSAERMSSGDFATRLPVVGADAGARVATSLNDLAAELQARIGALETSVDRLDRTLAAIDDGVCTWSASGELETWNAGAEALTGLTAAAVRAGDAPAATLLRAHLRPGHRRVLLPVGGGESHVVVELSVREMRDGGLLQVFADAAPVLSIEQARANFLVTAAHELRTPLTSILGFAATLADDGLDLGAEMEAEATRQVLEQALRLDAVVTSLFESSLIVRGKVEVSLERIDVGVAVREALDASVVGDADATVVLPVGGALARADRASLGRALAALLDNAGKYGSPPVTIRVEPAGELVRIVVGDDGPGIAPELREAVFEPFHRIDPEMRSEVGGAGMGLYNARRLVDAMGGSVSAGEGAGGGAELVVELPAWGAAAAATQEARDAAPLPTARRA